MRSKVQVLLAVLALAASGCPLPQPPLPSSQAPGVWAARVPGPDGGGRIVTLWLQSGGVATLETVDIGKERLPPVHGVWSATGDEVTVQLRGEDGQRAERRWSTPSGPTGSSRSNGTTTCMARPACRSPGAIDS